jgi:hypothetical protein
LPEPIQTGAISPWLDQAARVSTIVDCNEAMARWLVAVATIITVRIHNRGEMLPPRIKGESR